MAVTKVAAIKDILIAGAITAAAAVTVFRIIGLFL